MRVSIKKGSRPKELLKLLARPTFEAEKLGGRAVGSGILVLSLFDPTLPSKLLAAYFRNRRFQRRVLLRDLRRLQERQLLDWQERPDGSVRIILTRRGQEVGLMFKLEEMKIKKPAHWDKKWRLVMFDIPHGKKRARDALRRKLKGLGFYQLQKSVFICPYPCEDEIDFIGSVFDVREHILIITSNHFEGSEKLRHHFGLGD